MVYDTIFVCEEYCNDFEMLWGLLEELSEGRIFQDE